MAPISEREPEWMRQAVQFIGLSEIAGPKHNETILKWWRDIKRGGIKSDEVPWCAAFVGAMLEQSGVVSTRFESARSYLDWGQKLTHPVYGCVAVFSRDGGGHVGFVTGLANDGKLLILGGNQSNAVNIRAFGRDRLTGLRWPKGVPVLAKPLVVGSADTSTSEA